MPLSGRKIITRENIMPSPSKVKGSSFERDIAKYLSDLYKESFIRAPGSGAYVGGKNQARKEVLHEGQIRNFKGDIVPGESFINLNVECKSYADFPFHLVLTGFCKQLDEWLDQLMTVAEPNDLNVLFMKFNRKGKFVCVPSKYTWVTDQFLYYTSNKHADWVIIEFDHFFQYNKDTFKAYSGSIDTKSTPLDTQSISTTPVSLN
jgi:Holliday junction resolvase